MKRIALSWSSGKDSAWSLHLLKQDPAVEVVALLTTLNEEFNRVAMHAVRRELLESQAEAAGLPLWAVPLPWPCSNQQYESRMRAACERAMREGVQAIAFGDLFLADIRAYREKQLHGTGLDPLFPVWLLPTKELATNMIAAGLRAKITCVDPRVLSPEFAGRDFDAAFLADLPPGVDPCGENGEFHTFVYDGPMFTHAISVEPGEVVERDGFVFADFKPR
ncbi:MAG TPA: ATP-binding protein [Bryobacteraceae bacterium]|nr:ATP-binding protein [Bryobacteraceae bacterium]